MANNLTGDYEAVLQISVRQVNGILATMHQNRIDKNISPSFPHNGSIRVGDPPLSAGLELGRFSEWVTGAVQGLRATTGAAEGARAVLSDKAPPGTASMFQQAWRGLDLSALEPGPPGAVSGRADFQLSTPTISLPAGSVSEVTVHAWVRAQYYPDVGAGSLPEPIHGEVRALYVARPTTLADGRAVLRVEVTPDDSQIEFAPAPGTGLGAAATQALTARIRAALRKHFRPVDVALAGDFAFWEFKGLGSGPTEAVVLPLQLSGAPFPAGSMPSVTNHFLGTSEFAIAVSKEYIQRFLDALVNAIRARAAAVRISVSGLLGTASYTASLSSISLVWKAGAIEISGRIDLVTGTWWAPNGYITFTQAITAILDEPSQTVSVQPVGDPAVDESWWLSHARAVNAVTSARDGALPAAGRSLGASFADARSKLAGALASFDNSATVRYTALEVTPDGIIVSGAIGTRVRLAPVVDYAEIDGGNAFNAVLSWIPGGRIEQYDWTWVETTQLIPWHNKTKHVFDEHRFICPRPAEVASVGAICLLIRGSRVSPDGRIEVVEAGETCGNSSHEPLLSNPSWWLRLMLPMFAPDPPPDFVVSDVLTGHINIAGGSRTPGSITTNALVHFAGRSIERPLERLAQALSRTRRPGLSLLVILVLPAGAFAGRRSELEARLGSAGDRFQAQLLITEDYVGGWTKTFAAPDGPSSHLINARGEFVWSAAGTLDPDALARALDRHALAAPPARRVAMRLNVQPGMPALDALFTDERGGEVSLRRLRGRRVLLVFWQSWSAPCIRELRGLERERQGGAFVLAVNGGEDREILAEVRRRHDLTFALIHDPDQLIGTLYGVQCWPTTVSINEDGIVDRIQFGLTHARRDTPAGPPA